MSFLKIDKLQINGFGNIGGQEINLKNKINIIYGKNESGKSTLLKFIINMFYGASKNKKGKNISDFDRFKPWNTEEFSGKISYTLDDNKKYEIFREFGKRNPKIYNEIGDDISKDFNIDKNKGNEFFYEQTKVDEEMFLASTAVMQEEVKLDKQNQNMIIQKIANLVGTGNDNISFKQCMDKINKKLLTEVGTDRSQDRPINKVRSRIDYIESQKEKLNLYKDKKYQIEEDKRIISEELNILEQKVEFLKDVKEIKERYNIQKEKVKINRELETKYDEQIEKLNNEKNQLDDNINRKNINSKRKKMQHSKYIILFVTSILLNIISICFIKKEIINYATILISISILIIYFVNILLINKTNKKQENREKLKRIKILEERKEIEKEIEINKKNKEDKVSEIMRLEEQVRIEENSKKEEIRRKYVSIIEIGYINDMLNKEEINRDLEENQTELNEKKLKLRALQLEEQNIIPNLENLSAMEEELELLQEEYEELKLKNISINVAKESIQKAYNKMKENVTPRFTKSLSEKIERISNGKYKKVKFNSENGLIVELENGQYIPAELLSTGTIDQLYLSLRLAVTSEISSERIPLILDEAFVYYDEQRLENILKYISDEVENQVLILTCTKREINALEKLDISYNLINI